MVFKNSKLRVSRIEKYGLESVISETQLYHTEPFLEICHISSSVSRPSAPGDSGDCNSLWEPIDVMSSGYWEGTQSLMSAIAIIQEIVK